MESSMLRKRMPVTALADPAIVVPAIWASFAKLDPRLLIKNPVMFVVEIVAALTTVISVRDLFTGVAAAALFVAGNVVVAVVIFGLMTFVRIRWGFDGETREHLRHVRTLDGGKGWPRSEKRG